jgi:hypothetical protein
MQEAPKAWQFQDRLATAFDDVRVLDEMGSEGWELTGFGPLVLHFRRPQNVQARTPWAQRRTVELPPPQQRSRLEQGG